MKRSKTKYDLSVVIPTYNRSQLLGFTLDSLLRQNISLDRFEVIVGDDGSSDDTKEMLDKYGDRLHIKYAFQEDKGYRPASARNKGIRLSEGAVCLFVDAGIILATDCVAEHCRFHQQQNPRVAAIGYIYGFDYPAKYEDMLVKLIVPGDPSLTINKISGYDFFLDARELQYVRYKDKIENLPAPWFFFWSGHVSVKTADLFNVDLFDEKYDGRWGMEDIDLGCRLYQSGVRISLLRSAGAVHYPHDRNRAERHEEGYTNCLYFHSKFQTLETKLYLDNYRNEVLPDINAMCIRMRTKDIDIMQGLEV